MNKINELKKAVTSASKNPSFVHHKWYIKYHLNFVEKISLELCEIYKDADKEIVQSLVWVHDYGKILGIKDDTDLIANKITTLMKKVGYETDVIKKITKYFKIFESKLEIDLQNAPVEVKIVSSADGASHMIGPFYSIYWYENSNKDIEELMEDNKNKAMKDWGRKIVLPEIEKAFKTRNQIIRENSGEFPDKFVK